MLIQASLYGGIHEEVCLYAKGYLWVSKNRIAKIFIEPFVHFDDDTSFSSCGKNELEDYVDAQIKLNEHNLINNSGVKWVSDQEARRSYKTACANALGLHGTGKLEEN